MLVVSVVIALAVVATACAIALIAQLCIEKSNKDRSTNWRYEWHAFERYRPETHTWQYSIQRTMISYNSEVRHVTRKIPLFSIDAQDATDDARTDAYATAVERAMYANANAG